MVIVVFEGFKLFDRNMNFLGYIKTVFEDTAIDHEINKLSFLRFTTPYNEPSTRLIAGGYLIQYRNKIFIVHIKRKSWRGGERVLEVTAEQRATELTGQNVPLFSVKQQTAQQAAMSVLQGNRYGWTLGDVESAEINSIEPIENKNVLINLMTIADVYRLELEFDDLNKVVHFRKQLGTNRGTILSCGYNMEEIDETEDMTGDFGTRIIPIGKDGLDISEVSPGGENYIDADTQSLYGVIDYVWKTEITNPTLLYEMAQAQLELIKHPLKSYEAKVIDLKEAFGVEEYGFELGDTVKVKEESLDILITSRVVKVIEKPTNPENTEITIDNLPINYREMQVKFAEMLEYVEDNKDLWDNAGAISDEVKIEFGRRDYEDGAEFKFTNYYYEVPTVTFSLQKESDEATIPTSFQAYGEFTTGKDENDVLTYTGVKCHIIGGAPTAYTPGLKITMQAMCTANGGPQSPNV